MIVFLRSLSELDDIGLLLRSELGLSLKRLPKGDDGLESWKLPDGMIDPSMPS